MAGGLLYVINTSRRKAANFTETLNTVKNISW